MTNDPITSENAPVRPFHLYPGGVAAALAFIFVCMAWVQRIMLDDAFISFRYAANLVHGHGLVWNPGEVPVEGYTNFLWTLIMAAGYKAGLDPAAFSTALGILLFALVLATQFFLASRLLDDSWGGTVAVLLLGGLHTFRAFATGGMETMLQTLFVLLALMLLVSKAPRQEISDGQLLLLSLVSGAAVLTRMDSALIVAAPMVWAASLVIRHRLPGTRSRAFARLFGPLLLIVTTWLAWKLAYYGSILPNTFYVKTSGPQLIPSGLAYVHHFLSSYFLYPFLLLLIITLVVRRKTVPAPVWAMAATCLIWAIYLVRVGGDFIEYRFFVPVMPFLMLLVVWAAWETSGSLFVRGGLVLLLLSGSLHHQMTHRATSENSLPESSKQLDMRLTDDGDAWIATGRSLGELFGDVRQEPVTIAVTAAGAIPYYSGLRTVDMLGLSDPWISRNGLYAPRNAPGHQWVAPVSYLRDRGVHLLLGHPTTRDAKDPPSEYLKRAINLAAFMERENVRQLSPQVRIVEIPVLASKKLVAVYLSRNEQIDKLIARGVLRSYQVDIDMQGFEQDPAAATVPGGS